MNGKIPCHGYYRTENLNEAIELLAKLGDTAKPIAGGTDVLPRRPGGKWVTNRKNLIDLSRLGLDYIERRGDSLAVGAMSTINSILDSPFFSDDAHAAIVEAAGMHSTQVIRNRATLGGNLCTGWPIAEFSLPLLVLNAVIVAVGPFGERQISMNRFFTGVNLTDLRSNELLKEILIPDSRPHTGTAFKKLRRHQTAVDLAIVNVAAGLTVDSGTCLNAKIALGGVGPVPFCAEKAERILIGKTLTRKNIETAATVAAGQAAPIDDVRATAAYRKKMIFVLVRDAVLKSVERGER